MLKMKSLKTTIKNLAVVSGSAVLITLAMSSSAIAAILYELIDLNPDDSYLSYMSNDDIPTDINDSGQIIGYISNFANNRYRPGWVWSRENGRTWINDSSGQVNTLAIIPFSINNAGQVSVYRRSSDYGSWSGIWNPSGQVTLLQTSFYLTSSAAYGINNLGQVVGYVNSAMEPRLNDIGEFEYFEGQDRAVLWNSSTERIDIGTLPGGERSNAIAINDAGQVVGFSESSNGGRAFLWSQETGIQDLGVPPGADYSYAYAINNQGQVLGFSDSGQERSSFLWSQEIGMIPLPIRATDINDRGQVVGYCPGEYTEFCLWSLESGIINLDITVDPTIGWKLTSLTGINNNGEIVGYGRKSLSNDPYNVRPFLLTPKNSEAVPEPMTMGGTLLAGIGLAYLRRRQVQLRSSKVTD